MKDSASRSTQSHLQASSGREHDSLDAGLTVQLENLKRLLDAGWHHVGWKLALTDGRMRDRCGVAEPTFGYLLAESRIDDGERLASGSVTRMGVEAEIAAVVNRDIGPHVTTVDACQAIGALYPALELVQNRVSIFRNLPGAAADNFGHTAYVLGQPVGLRPGASVGEVELHIASKWRDRQIRVEKSGLDVPALIVWLAGKLSSFGQVLQAGQVVLTGSLNPWLPIKVGQFITADFGGIGRVSVSI